MKVLFAPDYRKPNSYQTNLGRALEEKGVSLSYVRGRLPLFELQQSCASIRPDILHLHWPEGLFVRFEKLKRIAPGLSSCLPLGEAHYLLDLFSALAVHRVRLVLTAHNLWPHRNGDSAFTKGTVRRTAQRAHGVIAHSASAARTIADAWDIEAKKIEVIPHGDLSAVFGELPPPEEARKSLPIPETLPLFLIFGVIEDYKGIDEVVEAWKKLAPPARLAIIGHGKKDVIERLRKLSAGIPSVHFLAEGRLPEEMLQLWLAAADGAIFNYRRTLTSGAASLTRSLGIPTLIHRRAGSIDLGEPHPAVFRYESMGDEFNKVLHQAMALIGQRPPKDTDWAETTSWPKIADSTVSFYKRILAQK